MSKLAGESESNLRKGLLHFLRSYFNDFLSDLSKNGGQNTNLVPQKVTGIFWKCVCLHL